MISEGAGTGADSTADLRALDRCAEQEAAQSAEAGAAARKCAVTGTRSAGAQGKERDSDNQSKSRELHNTSPVLRVVRPANAGDAFSPSIIYHTLEFFLACIELNSAVLIRARV
jgi:hypothetical protein